MIYYLNQMALFKSPHIQSCKKEDIIAYLDSTDEFGLDTETSGLNPFEDRLLCIVIGDNINQYFIDARQPGWEFLKPYLESRDKIKIGANIGFDYKFLLRKGIVMNKVFDVINSDLALSQDKKNRMSSLADLVSEHLGEYMDKSVRNSFIGMTDESFTDSQVFYACDDIKYLQALKSTLMAEEAAMGSQILNLENAMSLVLADMEYEGIRLNREPWEKLAAIAEENRRKWELELDAIILKDKIFAPFVVKHFQTNLFIPDEEIRKVEVLWTSPKQVLKVLQAVAPGLESTNSEELNDYKGVHPIIDTYIEFADWGKKASTYGMDFFKYVYPDGRVRTEFMPVVSTGRLSSRNPNMQNIPADNDYRNCFIPNYDDWVFVSSDFSSQELCIIAYGADDPVWLGALREEKDLHSICAELLFGDTWKEAAEPGCHFYKEEDGTPIKQKCSCKKHKKLRDVVKALNFGLAYGMTETSLSHRMNISVEDAKRLIRDYYTAFPKIDRFMQSLSGFAKKKGYMKTMKPFQRRRKFKNWQGPYTEDKVMASIERMGRNTRIQGTGADMVKLALVLARQYLIENNLRDKVKLVLTVHDEINSISTKDYAETWKLQLKSLMEKAALAIVPLGLIKTEPAISHQWEK